MNFELFRLMEMVRSGVKEPVLCLESEQDCNSEFHTECNRILMSMHTVIAGKDRSTAKAYLLQHQYGLNNIFKKIEDLFDNPDNNRDDLDYLKDYQKPLSWLLNEIKTSFPNYFDHNMEVPRYLIKEYNLKQELKLQNLIFRINQNEIPEEFTELILVLFKVDYDTIDSPNFSKLDYLDKSLKILEHFFSNLESFEPFKLITELISNNFNHPIFYDFCCGFIIGQAELTDNISDQFHTLHFLLKKINQIQTHTSLGYDENLPNINDSLKRYINSEIEFIKSLDFLSQELASGGLIEKSYRVSLTVRQLAIFIHLQVEVGIILTEKPRLIHQYVAKHFTTSETETISEKSFKNSYYGNSKEDLEKIIPKIAQMLILAQEKL